MSKTRNTKEHRRQEHTTIINTMYMVKGNMGSGANEMVMAMSEAVDDFTIAYSKSSAQINIYDTGKISC